MSHKTPDVHSDMLKLYVNDSRMQFLYHRLSIFCVRYNLMSTTLYLCYWNINYLKVQSYIFYFSYYLKVNYAD